MSAETDAQGIHAIRTGRRTVLGGLAATALAAGTYRGTQVAEARPRRRRAAVATGDLAQDGAGQQRWLSIPGSRIAINPNNSTLTGGETSQNSGPALPLGANFIANDWYNQHRTVLQTTLASQTKPPEADGDHPFPEVGDDPAYDERFTDISGWQSTSGSATISVSGGLGTVKIGKDSASGSVTKTMTVDLDRTPILAVDVRDLTDQWAIKLHDEELDKDYTIQTDTDRTGVFVYDIAQVTGWSGQRTFGVKIYACDGKKGSTTTYGRIAIFPAGVNGWEQRATRQQTTWSPDHLGYRAEYADNSVITGTDHFHSVDAIVRYIDASKIKLRVALAGTVTGPVEFDADRHVISMVEDNLTCAIAVPSAGTVTFSQAAGWDPSPTPTAASTYWNVAVPGGGRWSVGIGFAVGDDRAAATDAALAAARSDPKADIARWTRQFDALLAKVPTPSDFALHGVQTKGVTADDVRSAYYRGWINLSQNVLPATPETGNSWAAIGTDKADNWMKGVPGAANVASWDSLLAAQNMVYVDADIAWSTLACVLTQVQNNGELDGQNLPSRLAQTLWVLYQVSGDRDWLTKLYPDLVRFLPWEADHPRWISATNDIADEVNASYVVSLGFDLTFAIKIATELDKRDDVRQWQSLQAKLIDEYRSWFVTADKTLLSLHYLDQSHPDATGDPLAESTAIVLADLPDDVLSIVQARFDGMYAPAQDFAGLATGALKAPHEQLLMYGLLDRRQTDAAAVINNTVLRDIVRSGRFAEVYHPADGTLGNVPIGTGVWPSTFGISGLIDAVWLNNGYRYGGGEPATVKLPGTTGTVTGLTHLGKPYTATSRKRRGRTGPGRGGKGHR